MGKIVKPRNTGATPKTDRKHLTDREVNSLMDAATTASRNKERDRCLLLLAYRYGFSVSEICALPLDHVDIEGRVLHVKRLKRGLSEEALAPIDGKSFVVGDGERRRFPALRRPSSTCCAIPAVSRLPIKARIPGSFRTISATGRLNVP